MTDRIKAVTASDWGPALHKSARVAATIAALLICLAELTLELARQTREAIDARNEQLSAWWVNVLGVALTDATPMVAALPMTASPFALLPAVAVAAPPRPPVAPGEDRPRPVRKTSAKATKAPAATPRPARRRKPKAAVV